MDDFAAFKGDSLMFKGYNKALKRFHSGAKFHLELMKC